MANAIILAGGRSIGLPGDTLKQYRRVNGDKMLITYSLEAFINNVSVDKITVINEDETWEEMILFDLSKRDIAIDKLQLPFCKV